MKILVTVPGYYPGLNEYVDRNRIRRGHWSAGNAMKQHDQHILELYIRQQIKKPLNCRIRVHFTYFAPDRKKDPDNIDGYFRKCFMDALVKTGNLPDDGWKYIAGYSSSYEIDKADPRIEITITRTRK